MEPKPMNKMLLPCLVALAATAVATTAWSDEANVVTDPPETKIVCKKEPVMGSRIQQRVCKTQAQIDKDRQNAKEATDTWQRDGNIQKTSG
jgi:hypothetical protein